MGEKKGRAPGSGAETLRFRPEMRDVDKRLLLGLGRSTVAVGLGVSMLLVPVVGQAGPASVQIQESSMPAALPSADRERLEVSLREGLSQAGLVVSEAAGGDSVRMRVEQSEADYVVTLELLDPAGTVSADASVECELCGVAELSETITAAASRLRQRLDLQENEATLSVITRPAEATVLVDGEEAGLTPLETPIPAGDHEVVVERDGYRPIVTSFEATGGARSSFDFGLRREAYRTAVPWTLIGGGALSVIGGATLLAIHGDPIRNGCNADAAGNCEFIRRTRPGGIAAVAVGTGLLVSGIVLAIVWRERRQGSRRTARRHGYGSRL